mgnify:CR=1 FL=1
MKIVNKKRFITSITILMIILIALLNKCVAYKSIKTENYTVSTGDTLWSIACEYKKTGQDVRSYLYELRELNELNDCIIYPGQVIKIIK